MAEPLLTIGDFAPHRGKPAQVQASDGAIQLTLAEAQELPGAIRKGGSFRLEFHGPLRPELRQGTYRFKVGARTCDIFIVPIGRTPRHVRYEAIFY